MRYVNDGKSTVKVNERDHETDGGKANNASIVVEEFTIVFKVFFETLFNNASFVAPTTFNG